MLRELWESIRGEQPAIHHPASFKASLPDLDEADTLLDEYDIPTGAVENISGLSCIIHYLNAKGTRSERRVTFHRFEEAKGQRYLRGYCHERSAPRSFRLDRVAAVIDLHTGEVWEPGALFFSRFEDEIEYTSGLSWGLSVTARADLIAGLNAIAFMARCDREFHPAEREVIEEFITSFWMRGEYPHELPVDEILGYAERLKPDAEMFFIALVRLGDKRELARLVKRHLQAVVAADGVIKPEETFWGSKVDSYLSL